MNKNTSFAQRGVRDLTGTFALLLALVSPSAFAATTWDANTGTVGAQDGTGTWDTTTANWYNGTADVVWPNTTATTASIGTASGAAGTISVSGTVTLNAISFAAAGSGNYTLNNGTLSFGGTTPTISIAAALTPIINSVIGESSAGTAVKFTATGIGSGSITLGGANNFTGSPTISQATVIFNSLANGGSASSFGSGANTVPVILGNNGSAAAATYTGAAASTDRPWNLTGVAGGNTINNNGSGAISFNNTGATATGTAGNRTLTLQGSYTASANTFAQTINDLSGFFTVLKVAANTWNITGANTHFGGITINSAGVLNIGNASAFGSGTLTNAGNGFFDNTTGSDLTVANGMVCSGGSPTYIGSANNMTLNGAGSISGGNRSITVTARTLTLAGAIGEDVAGRTLTRIGAGTLTLSGANTFSGGVTLNTAGQLNINNNSALGSGVLNVAATTSFDNTSAGLITVANAITLAGNPTFVGSTNLTLNGAVTLSGANRTVTVTANTLTLGGQITGALTLTKAGNGTLVLNNTGSADTHSGTLASAGTLDLGGTSQALGAVTFSGASTTQNGTINASSYSATLSSGMAMVSANLAGSSVALSYSGAGNLALFGVNTYNGGTTIGSAGTLFVTNDVGLGNASAGLLFSASGTLAATNNNAAVISAVTIGSSRTITVNSTITANFATPDTNNLTIAAKITGAGNILKKSSSFSLGTVRFSNDTSDYTGDFSVGFGNTEFTSVADQGIASSLGAGAAGSGGQISLGNGSSAGTLRYVGTANSSTHRPLNWTATTASGYTLDASGSGTVQFLATGIMRSGTGGATALILRGSNTGANTLAQVINDQGGVTSLTKNDAGTWVLSAANTFSGPVSLIGGVLQVNATETPGTSGPLGKSGTITFTGGTLQYSSADNADYSARFSTAATQPFKIDCNGQSVTYATSLAGAGNSLTVSSSTGGGALTLTASNTFTGSTTIRSGTLALSGSGAIATSPAVSIAAAATFDVSGGYTLATQTLYATNGATATINGSLNLGSASLVITNTPGTPTITVTGGTLTLASGNATTVNINNGGTPLGAGTYKLISKGAGGSVAGTAPSSITVGGNGLAGGATAQLQITAGELFLFVCAAPTATVRSADSMTNCPATPVTIHADLTGAAPWNVTWSDGTVQNGVATSPATLSVAPATTTTYTVTSVSDSCAGAGSASGSAVVTMSSESAPVFSGALAAAASSTNVPVTIAKVKLMALASDPENDPLTLSGVATSSLQGGTVVQNGSISITYTPASGYAGGDSFTYWVSDGCKLATNTVNVTVGSGNGTSPNVVYGPVIDGTDFVVRFAGIPSYTYTIEYSDSPTGPWAKKTNLTAPTDNSQGFGPGIFEFRESTLGVTARYYRTVYPSY